MTTEKNEPDENNNPGLFVFPDLPSEIKNRTAALYGEVNEEQCKLLLGSLYYYRDAIRAETEETELLEQSGSDSIPPKPSPIEIVISTEGGSVHDMFAVYDCIREVKKECKIHTLGVGKVMSAGVLLLASGTKGLRSVGKHCRLMLHAVSGGQYGSLKELAIDLKEVKWHQEQFIKALTSETKLTEKKIRSIFRKKTDTYFDAEQALEWGIVDEII